MVICGGRASRCVCGYGVPLNQWLSLSAGRALPACRPLTHQRHHLHVGHRRQLASRGKGGCARGQRRQHQAGSRAALVMHASLPCPQPANLQPDNLRNNAPAPGSAARRPPQIATRTCARRSLRRSRAGRCFAGTAPPGSGWQSGGRGWVAAEGVWVRRGLAGAARQARAAAAGSDGLRGGSCAPTTPVPPTCPPTHSAIHTATRPPTHPPQLTPTPTMTTNWKARAAL